MSDNPLSTLKIDYWYKMLPVIGSITLVLALSIDIKGVTNVFVQLVSIGVIFIGIGEWINHPLQTHMMNVRYKVTSYNRVNNISGNLWDLIGLGIILYAFFYKI